MYINEFNLCIDFDDCAGNPCMNGGDCTDGLYEFTCNCTLVAYDGEICQYGKYIYQKF